MGSTYFVETPFFINLENVHRQFFLSDTLIKMAWLKNKLCNLSVQVNAVHNDWLLKLDNNWMDLTSCHFE